MTIAIADWHRFGRHRTQATDAVRAKLSALESGDTRVIESIEVEAAGCAIDHVIIGPAGVFTVTVHEERARDIHIAHYGMSIDGTAVPYLRQAKFEAEQIARAIGEHVAFDVPVRGCVVMLTGSHEPQIHYDPHPIGVSILSKGDVPRWFGRQPVTLEPSQVRAAYEIARRLPTSA